jgi:ferredoxin-NADP reductase/MOSC domain-containing protein YiiM/ferredoxin
MDRVVSVNVGLPREIKWRGGTARTAIWKQSVSGRVMARQTNLEGDGQGDLIGHGGEQRAIFVYQLDSYRYWQTYFGEPEYSFGHFGENLTVDGLPDDQVCIGDQFRIGRALVEVTQPRVTCFRVGIRTNHPEMPALLVSHHRPGFYLRVLEEGDIGAEDQIVKVTDGPEHMTVAEIDALLYLPDHPRDKIERALRIAALSIGWKQSFQAMLEADENGVRGNAGLSPQSEGTPLWQGFRKVKVLDCFDTSDGVRSFVLGSEDNSALPIPLAGQHLVVRVHLQSEKAPVSRSYSISGAPNAGTYRISVKREGLVSEYLHEHLLAGDELEVSAPRGTFTLIPGNSPIALISAGIGVTPLLAMLHTLSAEGLAKPREVWWIHGARDGNHFSFRREVERLLKSIQNSRKFFIFSRPSEKDKLGADYDAIGHISGPMIQQLNVPTDSEFYLCGPAGFLHDLSSELTSWGIKPSRIHIETFGGEKFVAPMKSEVDSKMTGSEESFRVSFTRSNVIVPWQSRYNSLLELAEAHDIPVRWSCRVGVCHTCESGIIDGRLKYSPEPLEPPAEGRALICCSVPLSDVELDL